VNRRIAVISSVVVLVCLFFGFREKRPQTDSGFRYEILNRLPVHFEGRPQALSSVANASLGRIHGKRTIRKNEGINARSIEWLCETLWGDQETSRAIPIFTVQNKDIRAFLLHRRDVNQHVGWRKILFGESADSKVYAYNEISSQFPRIQSQTDQAKRISPKERTRFQKSIIELSKNIELYEGLERSVQLDAENRSKEIAQLEKLTPEGQTALKSRNSGALYDHDLFDQMMGKWYSYDSLKQRAELGLIPSSDAASGIIRWRKFASVIDDIAAKGSADPIYWEYARLADGHHEKDPAKFNQAAQNLMNIFADEFPNLLRETSFEHEYNRWAFPRSALAVFVVSLCGIFIYWIRSRQEILAFSYWLSLGGLSILSAEIICRSVVAGNASLFGFYATSIFLSWCTMLMGLALQRRYWNGLSLFAANSIASSFLAIAVYRANQGSIISALPIDVSSNFLTWGHVSMTMIGYACSLLAGTIGLLFHAIAIFTCRMSDKAEQRFGSIGYRLISLSTGFLVVGALLGCLWSQQAFGRFWAWEPGKSGALLVILWNAVILHTHWGGFAKSHRFLAMTVFGNILCLFSLVGVDVLIIESGTQEPSSLLALIWLISANFVGLLLLAIPRSRWRSISTVVLD